MAFGGAVKTGWRKLPSTLFIGVGSVGVMKFDCSDAVAVEVEDEVEVDSELDADSGVSGMMTMGIAVMGAGATGFEICRDGSVMIAVKTAFRTSSLFRAEEPRRWYFFLPPVLALALPVVLLVLALVLVLVLGAVTVPIMMGFPLSSTKGGDEMGQGVL
jgi:hypothetical protein